MNVFPHTQRIGGDRCHTRFQERIARDEFGQARGRWSDFDLDLLAILEEVSSEGVNPDKPLAAYVADIRDLFAGVAT